MTESVDPEVLYRAALGQHGHALLSFSVPRWQKQVPEHSRGFWETHLQPLLSQAQEVWFHHAFPAVEAPSLPESPEFLQAWLRLIDEHGPYESLLVVFVEGGEDMCLSLLPVSESVGVMARASVIRDRALRAKVSRYLANHPCAAVVVSSPPFASIAVLSATTSNEASGES